MAIVTAFETSSVSGGEQAPALASLRAQGTIHDDARRPPGDTRVELASEDWQLRLEGLAIGSRRVDADAVTLSGIDQASIDFHDVRPEAVAVAAHGLYIRGARLRAA